MKLHIVLHDGLAINDTAFRCVTSIEVLVWGGERSSRADAREGEEGAHLGDGWRFVGEEIFLQSEARVTRDSDMISLRTRERVEEMPLLR